ncbi:MAG TPA: hypothetical protein VGK25_07130 [Ignavibacteria bacterium]|jgi:hypothetical protein
MLKVVITYLLFFTIGLSAQSITVDAAKVKVKKEDESSLILLLKEDKNTLSNETEQNAFVKSEADFRSYSHSITNTQKKEEKPTFNIVSSFRGNIRWGGFWENYAIVNFTPEMFIQPFDFISIYANQHSSNYIPIQSIKQDIKPLITPLLIRGLAVLAIDNSVKFLLASNKFIQQITGFALKNLAINLLKSSSQNMMEFKYYYCAVSIKFNYAAAFSLLK